MEAFLLKIFDLVVAGGPQSIVSLLILSNIGLYIERRRLIALLEKKDEKIDKIIEQYAAGNISLTETLNGLKLILVELKAKI